MFVQRRRTFRTTADLGPHYPNSFQTHSPNRHHEPERQLNQRFFEGNCSFMASAFVLASIPNGYLPSSSCSFRTRSEHTTSSISNSLPSWLALSLPQPNSNRANYLPAYTPLNAAPMSSRFLVGKCLPLATLTGTLRKWIVLPFIKASNMTPSLILL